MESVESDLKKKQSLYLAVIGLLSILIPVLVAILIFIPQTGKLGDLNVSFLPQLNAVLNSATAICLLAGFYFIKQQKIHYHRMMMFSAVGLSGLFLISYVLYHYQAPHTIYGGTGSIKSIYYFILLTHIFLAIIVVPLVFLSVFFAVSGQIIRHKKLVKWTFPVWLYVAFTGVVVYLMISPYYRFQL